MKENCVFEVMPCCGFFSNSVSPLISFSGNGGILSNAALFDTKTQADLEVESTILADCCNIHDLILGTWRGGPHQWVG